MEYEGWSLPLENIVLEIMSHSVAINLLMYCKSPELWNLLYLGHVVRQDDHHGQYP